MTGKKITALILAAMLTGGAVSMLAGCGSSNDIDLTKLVPSGIEDTIKDTVSSDGSESSTTSSLTTADGAVCYITGTNSSVSLREGLSTTSDVVANLSAGEEVLLLNSDNADSYLVCTSDKSKQGYVSPNYLTDNKQAVTDGSTYYTTESTVLHKDADSSSSQLEKLNKNTAVKVLAKLGGDTWRVYVPSDSKYGYVESNCLSTEKVKEESSSKASSSSGSSSSESKKSNSSSNSGSGTINYNKKWYVNVATGYLALRTAPSYDSSNEIASLYNGDYVYQVDGVASSGSYIWVYSPSKDAYGYINSDYAYLGSGDSGSSSSKSGDNSDFKNETKWYVKVDTGYLALRNAQGYDSSNEIGQLNNGDYVYVVSYDNYSDTYWWVYSPTLDKYGYVNSNYIFS